MNATASLATAIAPEDQARADFYALLARLYAKAPDSAGVLARRALSSRERNPLWAGSDGAQSELASPGTASSSRARRWTPRPRTRSTRTLFIGVGRSEGRPARVALDRRGDGGNGRSSACADPGRVRVSPRLPARTAEFEDHLAALCETMRMLVTGDDERPPTEIRCSVRSSIGGSRFRGSSIAATQ